MAASSIASEPQRRSSSQHRTSNPPAPASGIPIRQPSSKSHSHSLSTGSINQTHRVTRRKSTSSNAGNLAAVAAALRDNGDVPLATSVPSSRRGLSSKRSSSIIKAVDNLVNRTDNYPSPPEDLPPLPSGFESTLADSKYAAVIDGPPLDTVQSPSSDALHKARVRRASEGSHLIRGEGRRVASGELRCDQCGKGYKHSSCLTKHLWEHTPEWTYTSKLLISKHQQVQLLEAASVLVQMNQDGPTPPDSAKEFQSDHSSASPAASGVSEFREEREMSSTGTSPPPQMDETGAPLPVPVGRSRNNKTKRYSSASSGYSRSYQSAPAFIVGSMQSDTSNFGHLNRQSGEWATDGSEVDEAGLAAAVGLLSCSYGTPRSGPVTLPPDVPPVPPLPAQYLSNGVSSPRVALSDQNKITATTTIQALSPGLDKRHEPNFASATDTAAHAGLASGYHERDVSMDGSEESIVDEEDYFDRHSSRGRSEEYEVAIFGRMD